MVYRGATWYGCAFIPAANKGPDHAGMEMAVKMAPRSRGTKCDKYDIDVLSFLSIPESG
jgi:hypothetical protein